MIADSMNDKEALALLQQALGHLHRGDAAQTESVLSAVLRARPADPDALQLFGVLRREQKRDAEAEDFYRRSLAARPDQPIVHHNLGNLLRAQGRFDEAAASLHEAVRLKSNYGDAHLNLGLVQAELGDFEGAEKSIRRVLHIQPNFLAAKQSLGAVLNELGRYKEAETVLRQALSAAPPDAPQLAGLEQNLAMALSGQRRHDEALRALEAAAIKAPQAPFIDRGRAMILQRAGRGGEAVEAYRRLVQRNPLDIGAHQDLNQLLYRMGDDAAFLKSLDEAAVLVPDAPQIPLAKAGLLLQIDKFGDALEQYERASHLAPDDVVARDGMGLSLARLERFEDAIHAHEQALTRRPGDPNLLRNYAETFLRAGDAHKALSALEGSLARMPEHQGTLALMSTAYGVMDDVRGDVLNDFENLVQVFELEAPEGYSSIEAFNADLDHYLDGLHQDEREFIAQSLRGGTQTMERIFGRGHRPVELLRARIDEAVRAYISRMRSDEAHPLLRRRREGFAYSDSWSARLHNCGFHANHFHNKGWISSAYYVAVPEAVQAENQGWIKFGEPAFDAGLRNPIGHMVQPKVGKLVLFPSYMWHGTIPFQSQQARTTVAFDVVPR